ncbi:podocalyxin-like protein 2 [Hoplias malabaricus]|uniref:podocalyxin-like protein 2 n=1 Tax=Hoplias malabaricus TaxID=27720 RepID=UPI003461C79C
MRLSSFPSLLVGCSLLLLIPADVARASPVSRSSGSSRALLDVPLGADEREGVHPGLVENSQEISGFYSEDSEENKVPRAERQWGVQREVNTSLDTEALIGYNPSHPRLSSLSLRKEPREVNSSSFFVSTAEALNPERWEGDSESSGFPLHPSSLSLSTTAAGPLAHATVGTFNQNSPPAGATAAQDVPHVPEDEERQNLLTQAPTVPEAGPFPSHSPLQPDNPHRDHSEEEEEEDDDEEEDREDEDDEMVAFPMEVDGEEEDEWTHLTAGPSSTSPSDIPAVAFTQLTWQDVEVTRAGNDEDTELRHGGTEYLSETFHDPSVQVNCVDWKNLEEKGYIILNMSENYDCEEFRMDSGDRLLEMLESAFSRKMNSPQGSWGITLSKPSRKERQLLMSLTTEHEPISTKEVLAMLGEMRRGLYEIGIQNFSSVSTCHSKSGQIQSDYGKLFVVLVIIGSVCMIIIASSLIYICWQRRLPKMKNMSRGEELHFVENGCHDNPTLDVASDGQSEMQEKKHSANGVAVGSGGGGGGSGWQVLVNKPGKEEEDNQEEDTHL